MTETDLQNRIVGYARVGTYGQTLDAQLEQLKVAGCATVYREEATGAKVERRELQRMWLPRQNRHLGASGYINIPPPGMVPARPGTGQGGVGLRPCTREALGGLTAT